MAAGVKYTPFPVTRLPDVVSAKDFGPWEVFTAINNTGVMRGRPISLEDIYGLRHPSHRDRYVCARCGLVYEAVSSANTHRRLAHPKGKVHHNDKRELEVRAAARAVVEAEAPPEQLTFDIDEDGLDVAAPAILQGLAGIIASRSNARQRVAELENENAALRAQLAAIRQIVGGA